MKMKRIGWKISFIAWAEVTVIIQLETTVAGFISINNPDWTVSFASVICIILGLILLPLCVGVLAYLGHNAFK